MPRYGGFFRAILLGVLGAVVFQVQAQQWDWVNRFSGSQTVVVNMGVDAADRIYVAGRFSGTNQIGSNTIVSAGGTDVFIARLAPDGTPEWVISTGGPEDDFITRLIVKSNDTFLVCGRFTVNPTLASPSLTNSGVSLSNVVLALLEGVRFTWVEPEPPNIFAPATSMTLGHDDSLWLMGASNQVFIKRYSAGLAVTESMIVGQSFFTPRFIAVDSQERVFITGWFGGFVDLGTTNLSHWTGSYFTAALNSKGSARWAWFMEWFEQDSAGICIAPDGSVIAAGYWYDQLLDARGVLISHSPEDGAILWRRDYHEPRTHPDFRIFGMASGVDGIVHIAGSAWKRFHPSTQQQKSSLWIASVSPSGDKLSEEFMTNSVTGDGVAALTIAVNRQNDVMIGGLLSGTVKFGTNVMGPGPSGAQHGFVARRATVLPRLHIQPSNAAAALSWPRTALPFALQRNIDAASGAWSNVTEAPTLSNATRHVILPADGEREFFRLQKTNEAPIRFLPVIYGPSIDQQHNFLSLTGILITASNSVAGVPFSAIIEDEDSYPLSITWLDASGAPRTNGATITEVEHPVYFNFYYATTLQDPSFAFPLGTNAIQIVGSDGAFSVTNQLIFRVLSIPQTISELITAVEAVTTGAERTHLVTPLQNAQTAFSNGDFAAARTQLDEFKTRAQSSSTLTDPQKNSFVSAAQRILDALPVPPP